MQKIVMASEKNLAISALTTMTSITKFITKIVTSKMNEFEESGGPRATEVGYEILDSDQARFVLVDTLKELLHIANVGLAV